MKVYAITPKGQVTLPVSLREELNLKPGDKVMCKKTDKGILIEPARRNLLDDFGFLETKDKSGKSATIEEARKIIREKINQKNQA